MDWNEALFELSLPLPCQRMIDLCHQNFIPIYMRGGAIADFFLQKQCFDFDFYIGTHFEKFQELVSKPLGFELKQYGDWIPKEVRFIDFEDFNLDLYFIDEVRDFDEFFHKTHLVVSGPFNVNVPLYDFLNHRLYDPYGSILDLQRRHLCCFLSMEELNQIPRFYLETSLRFYSTHLIYKFPTFEINDTFTELIVNFNQKNPGKNEYLRAFPWRIESALLKLFTSDVDSFEAMIKFWKSTSMFDLFLPEFQEDTIVSYQTFEALNQLTSGQLAKRIMQASIPFDFINRRPQYRQFYENFILFG